MPRMQRNIYKRKDGRFAGNYIKSRDENGKAIYGYVYAKTYNEVKGKLENARTAVQNSEVKDVPKLKPLTIVKTVENYLNSAKPKYKKTSIDVYERYNASYIEPFFSNLTCENLTQQKMQEFSNNLLSNDLSVTTVQAVVNFLKKAVKSAMIGSVLNVDMPKSVIPEVQILSLKEQKLLEETAKNYDDNMYVAIMICLYLGLRIGEICGLKWEDIDFNEDILRIKRTMERVKFDGETKTRVEFLEPKSACSIRKIPVPSFLSVILKEHKIKNDGEFVLWKNKKFVEPRTVQYHFKKILQQGEIKDIKFHATRHTFVTRALEKGLDIKTISEVLGHSSAVVTMNKYAHVLDSRKRNQLEMLKCFYD